MEQLATGIQLADENLAARPARFVTDKTCSGWTRSVRRYDPDRRFHSWMNPAD